MVRAGSSHAHAKGCSHAKGYGHIKRHTHTREHAHTVRHTAEPSSLQVDSDAITQNVGTPVLAVRICIGRPHLGHSMSVSVGRLARMPPLA